MSSAQRCTIRVRENTWITRRKLNNSIDTDCGDTWRHLRRLLAVARKAALHHRRFVHRRLRLKLDSLPPRVEADSVFTGQWVGLVRDEEAAVIIEPKYRGFAAIYRAVVEAAPAVEPLWLATAALHLGPVAGLGSASLAALLLSRYLASTPPYVVEPSYLPTIPAPISKRIKPNLQLRQTAYAAAALLARTVRQVAVEAEALANGADFLAALGRAYTKNQEAILSTLRAQVQAVIAYTPPAHVEPDAQLLYELLLAARTAAKNDGNAGHMLLAPAPKIYEIFVLFSLHEAMLANRWRPEEQGLHHRKYRHTDRAAILHYNKPPPADSRLIRRLTGTPPHPDIVLKIAKPELSDTPTTAILDAKYMRIRRRKPLPLADALRLLAYTADLSKNHSLRAYIAAPTVQTEDRSYTASLDGTKIQIEIITVNHRVNQLEPIIKELTIN